MGDGNAPATRYSGMLSHATGKWNVTEAKKCGVHSYVVGKVELDQKWHSKVHMQFRGFQNPAIIYVTLWRQPIFNREPVM